MSPAQGGIARSIPLTAGRYSGINRKNTLKYFDGK